MKAKIVSCEKAVHPHYDQEVGADVPTTMILTKVEFWTDPTEENPQGELVHTQEYAHLPEDASPEFFQAQADAMQADLDHAKANAAQAEADKLADEKVAEISKLIEPQNNEQSTPASENQDSAGQVQS